MAGSDQPSNGPLPDPDAPEGPSRGETEQGPADDDPTRGLLEEDEGISVRDPDLVEPGLPETELGLLELGDVPDAVPRVLDEFGTPGGDEADAAAEELDEVQDLVAGSEPAELPGVTDDLFPPDEEPVPVRDAGEEGFDEDLSDALDDAVTTGDAAWRQSGPPDESDDLGGGLGAGGDSGIAVPPLLAVELSAAAPGRSVQALARCGRSVVAAFASAEGIRLEVLDPPGSVGALGVPLAFEDEEQQAVSIGVTERMPGAAAGPGTLHVATDRGMVFRWSPGVERWTVVDTYVPRGGARTSWLPLGVSRSPFRLCTLPGRGERLWAWRPGGPLLRADGDGLWNVEDAGPTLRTVAGDPRRSVLRSFFALDEQAVLRTFGPGDEVVERELTPEVADILQAPGATAAARDGVVWLACRDPELPVLRSDDDGARWSAMVGLRSVRQLLPLPDGGLLAAASVASEEGAGLWLWEAASGLRLVARSERLSTTGGEATSGGPPGMIEGLVAGADGTSSVWLLLGGRLLRVRFLEAPAGASS